MSDHPIEGLMRTAMNSIQDMVDVNTIIGEPIETTNGMVIIPISKVSVGFVAGGGEYNDLNAKRNSADFPMAGGTGGGFTVSPIGFFVVEDQKFKLIHADKSSAYLGLIKNATDVLKKFAEKQKWKN